MNEHVEVELRPVTPADLPDLAPPSRVDDPFGWFGFHSGHDLAGRFAVDGLLGSGSGVLIVTLGDESAGYVGWTAVRHGPNDASQALNIGIYLQPPFRGRGLAAPAHTALVDYLLTTTLFERIEAGTDVENTPEQRALARAGFTHEGTLRHAQNRAGDWHDLELFSILRGDRRIAGEVRVPVS